MNKSRISNLKNLIAMRRSRFLQTDVKAVVSDITCTPETPLPVAVEPVIPMEQEPTEAESISEVSVEIPAESIETTEVPTEASEPIPVAEPEPAPEAVVETSVEAEPSPDASETTEASVEQVPVESEALIEEAPVVEEQPVVKRRRRKAKETA